MAKFRAGGSLLAAVLTAWLSCEVCVDQTCAQGSKPAVALRQPAWIAPRRSGKFELKPSFQRQVENAGENAESPGKDDVPARLTATAVVPLRVDGELPTAPPVTDVVTYGDLPSDSLRMVTTARWINEPPRIEITINYDSLGPWHGNYEVTVPVESEGRSTVELQLPLVLKETQWQVPGELRVQREWTLGLFSFRRPGKTRLDLLVPKGPMPSILAYPVNHAPDRGGRLEVVVPGKDRAQPLGGLTHLDVSIREPFPLGESTGIVWIRSATADPLAIKYTVVEKHDWTAVVALALLGIVSGFVLRVGTQQFIEQRQSVIQYAQLLERIERETADRRDVELQRELDELRRDVEQSSAGQYSASTAEEFKTQQQRLEDALKRFETKQAELLKRFAELQPLLQRTDSLPAPLAACFAEVREPLESAGAALAEGNLDDGRPALNAHLTQLRESLAGALDRWQHEMVQAFQRIGQLPGWPATAGSLSAEQLQALENAEGELPENLGSTEEELPAIAAACERGRKLRRRGDRRVEAIARDLKSLEATVEPLGDSELQDAAAELAALEPEKFPADQVEALDRLRRAVQSGLDAVQGRIRVLAAEIGESVPRQVEPHLAAGHYEAAVDVLQSAAVPDFGGGVRGVPEFGHGQPAEPPGDEVDAESAAFFSTQASVVTVRQHDPVQRQALAAARSAREIAAARFLQSALVAVLLSFMAVSLFADTFIGTAANCAQVFFWGFSLDLGVNTLIDKAGASGG